MRTNVHSPLRSRRKSLRLISSLQVPRCLAKAAILCLRLKSVTAVTMASRFVLAPVNRIASCSSASGISIVVFMLLLCRIFYAKSRPFGVA